MSRTSKLTALAAIAVLSSTAFAAADPMTVAIEIFNASADRPSDRIPTPATNGTHVTVSTIGNGGFLEAVEHFNASADRRSDLVGTNGLTFFPSEPAYAADVFEILNAMD